MNGPADTRRWKSGGRRDTSSPVGKPPERGQQEHLHQKPNRMPRGWDWDRLLCVRARAGRVVRERIDVGWRNGEGQQEHAHGCGRLQRGRDFSNWGDGAEDDTGSAYQLSNACACVRRVWNR